MTNSCIETLHEISQLAQQIIALVDDRHDTVASTSSKGDEGVQLPDVAIVLPQLAEQQQDAAFLKQVLDLQLDARVVEKLSEVYSTSVARLYEHAQLRWRLLLPHVREGSIRQILKGSISRIVTDYKSKMRMAIIGKIHERIAQYNTEVQSRSPGDADLPAENGKGHSKLAVAILEKVFTRTTNITRAEKLKLANETGLEPRQVTIWFQNRRNRKPAAAVSTGTQKRKRAPDDADDDDYVAQRRKLSEQSSSIPVVSSDGSNDTAFSSSAFSAFTQVKRSPSDTTSVDELDSSASSFASSPQGQKAADPFDDSNMVFGENGQPRLDFNDLNMKASDFDEIPQRWMLAEELEFGAPEPAAYASELRTTSSQYFNLRAPSSKGATHVPITIDTYLNSCVQGIISPANVDFDALMRTFIHPSKLTDSADSEDCTSFKVDLDGLLASPTSQRSTAPTSVNSPTQATTEPIADPFDFAIEALGLTDIFTANKESFEHAQTLPSAEKLQSPLNVTSDTQSSHATASESESTER